MTRVMPLSLILLSAAILLVALFLPYVVSAQFSLPGLTDDFRIVATPAYPGPREFVHLSIEGLLSSTQDANVTWTVNGKTVTGAAEEGIDVQTGAAGEKLVVRAHVEGSSGTREMSLTLIPTSIDLLIDAESYVPPFFKGRPLASPGTALRVQAIPHFVSESGAAIPNEQITFTWRQDGSVVASGRGKATVTLPAPPLFGAATISVEARTQDGTYGSSASARLAGIDPGATLYINHPLVGIQYYHAIQNGEQVPETEATFVAVPYFAEAQSPNDTHLIYEWGINGRSVPAATTSASEITINAERSTGIADLSLTLSSSANFYVHAEQSWNIRFSGMKSAIPGVAPQSSSNIFHTGIEQ